MNRNSLRLSQPSYRLLAALLCCLPLGSACSDDEVAPAPPLTFSLEVTGLDGAPPDAPVSLRCDRGGPLDDTAAPAGGGAGDILEVTPVFSTLAVTVSIASDDDKRGFVLRPAHACGSSTRCGHVRIEGLSSDGQVLAAIDTVTTEGVLKLDLQQLPTQLRVSLIRGVDGEPVLNPDKTEVVTLVTPSFVVPADCEPLLPDSAGGAGGAAGAASAGAAGAGGAGGESSTPSAAGAGGADTTLGGAGGADAASSGAGGV